MRIGLLTFHHAHNCGAALQVLALQTILQQLGHEVTVINYRVARIDRSYETCSDLRKQRFERFLQDRLQLSPLYRSLRELQSAEHPYDILIAGSDQIWNESILGGLNSAYFCNFGTVSMRRIIYGASLGADTLSRNNHFLFPLFLQYPDFISVREPSMVPLLQPFTQKPIAVVSDPTLLLDVHFYQTLVPQQTAPAPYIYLHYVHHSGENPELDAAAQKLASLTGLPILKNRSGKRFATELPDCCDDGPTEFLARICSADYVITDSFHATVFSVLFRKHFLTVPPVKRPERLYELLQTLNLTSHCYGSGFSFEAFLTLSDYHCRITSIMSNWKQRSLQFLTQALTATPVQTAANYHSNANRFRCYGCGACAERFPDLINGLAPDAEGFLYPQSVDSSCNNPLSCIFFQSSSGFFPKDFSPQKTENRPASYLAYHRNLYERMQSYEGGILPEFFRQILQKDGGVIARAYNASSNTVSYQIALTEKDCTPFLSVRPQEANPLELYRLIREFFSSRSAPLLILAPPCHLFAVRALFSDSDYHLILLEEKCEGVCSSLPVLHYLSQVERHAQKPVRDYNLASKHFTKSGLRIEYMHDDNSLSCEYRSDSEFLKDYQQHVIQRPVCYCCHLHCNFPCIGDLAFASIYEKQSVHFAPPDKLLTYLSVCTETGRELFHSCKNNLHVKPLTATEETALFPRDSLRPFPLTISRPRYYQRLLQNQESSDGRPNGM